MGVWAQRPALRWLLPGLVLVVMVGGAATAWALSERAAHPPPRSADELLASLYEAEVDGFSGTVVQRCDLGLPTAFDSDRGGGPLRALISGPHTLRVWYAGPDQFRLALLETLGQSDIIRNGPDIWLWDSRRNEASHLRLPAVLGWLWPGAGRATAHDRVPALSAFEHITEVAADGTTSVAGRPAYQLVFSPTEPETKIRQVRLAIDAEHYVPLRVQVYGAAEEPACDLQFTHIDFDRPDAEQFRFNPPPGVTVPEPDLRALLPMIAGPTIDVLGEGWNSVLVVQLPDHPHGGAADLRNALESLPEASGEWGSGRLFSGTLFSALFTDDGRLLAGAVTPERLFQVAADLAALPSE